VTRTIHVASLEDLVMALIRFDEVYICIVWHGLFLYSKLSIFQLIAPTNTPFYCRLPNPLALIVCTLQWYKGSFRRLGTISVLLSLLSIRALGTAYKSCLKPLCVPLQRTNVKYEHTKKIVSRV
jgi:hypothetical protein